MSQTKYKRVLIYGATSGIAQATCRYLLGSNVVFGLVARDSEKLNAVAGDLKARGAENVHSWTMELSDAVDYMAHCGEVIQRMGTPDLILVAHGVLGNPPDLHVDWRAQIKLFQINLMNPISLLVPWADKLVVQGSGTIAVITSVAGDRGRQSNYVYGSSKAAMICYLQGLRNSMFKKNVRVVDIRPGIIDTPMTSAIAKKPLMVSADIAGRQIARGLCKNNVDILYAPWFWRYVMCVIKAIPEMIFKRLQL